MDQLIGQFIEHLPYLGVVVVLTLGGFGAPIPEDLPLLVGGYLCGLGKADVSIMLPLTLFTVIGADFLVYFLGRRWGHHVPKLPLLRRYLSGQLDPCGNFISQARWQDAFLGQVHARSTHTHFFSAGAFKLPAWKMLLFDGSAAMISVPVCVLLAWYLAKTVDFQTLRGWSVTTQVTLIAMVVVFAAGFVIWKLLRQRRLASTG